MDALLELAHTVVLRPYVFAFCAAFLALALPAWGWRRTLTFTALACLVAWAAEAASVRAGFPFPRFSYSGDPATGEELWVAGVPFIDPLSFVFLAFAGLQTARLLLAPVRPGPCARWDLRWREPAPPARRIVALVALGGVFTAALDVVMDPVTLRGEEWFLGRFYQYAATGAYFGVPPSNFAGWLLVSWTILGSFLALDRAVLLRVAGPWRTHAGDAVGGLALFAALLAFHIAVALAIGRPLIALAGCAWGGALLLPVLLRLRRATAGRKPAEAGGGGAPAPPSGGDADAE